MVPLRFLQEVNKNNDKTSPSLRRPIIVAIIILAIAALIGIAEHIPWEQWAEDLEQGAHHAVGPRFS